MARVNELRGRKGEEKSEKCRANLGRALKNHPKSLAFTLREKGSKSFEQSSGMI